MRVWTDLGNTLSMRSGRNSLFKAFKHSLRREWYPTLVMLRTLPKEGLAHDVKRDDFIRAWYELGLTINLDEDKEREEYERFGKRAAQSCSWRECRYHTEPAPNPSRVCVGCGEVVSASVLLGRYDTDVRGSATAESLASSSMFLR